MFVGTKGSFNKEKHRRYGSLSKHEDSPFHHGFKQDETSKFVQSIGHGQEDVVIATTIGTCSSTKTGSHDMMPRDEKCHRSLSQPNKRHPRDPRPRFWEAAKKASSLCLPFKRPIHIALPHPPTFENTPNNHLEWESFDGWKLLKKTNLGSSSQGPKKNESQEIIGKKPRLSWGDGLAKFEKIKTNVSANKDGNFLNPNLLVEKTTNATGFATPSFAVFTGEGDMMSIKAANIGNNDENLVGSPFLGSQNHGKGILEWINANSFTGLSSSVVELLESIDPSFVDYSLVGSTTLNKLVSWKAFMTNLLEVTETEIDSLENELKSLQFESGDGLSYSSLLVCHNAMSSNQDIGRSHDNSSSSIGVKDVTNANYSANFYFGTESTLYNTIISSNKDSAKRAWEALAMLLPKECCKTNNNIEVCSSSVSTIDAFIKEKFVEKKRFERFKEIVLTIKYKAWNHLWEKDLCLRSKRKCPRTSHSNLELDLQIISKGCKKNRSSMRCHFPFPAGKQLSLVPTSEMVSYTSQLLSKSLDEVKKNILKMPPLILDKRDKMFSMIMSSNGLVDDPVSVEKERSMINPWTCEEKKIFLEKFVAFGKDFRKISSFFDHKTTADCVEFYYKNHKSDLFEKVKKTKGSKHPKLCTAKTSLTTSSKKRKIKANVNSLQVLNKAPMMACNIQGNRRTRSRTARLQNGCDNMKKSTGGDRNLEKSTGFDILQDKRERIAVEALVSICDSRSSSKAIITRSVDPVEAIRDKMCLEVRNQCQQNVIPNVTQDIDHGTCYDEKNSESEMDPFDWTNEEKETFLQAVSSFGKDFTMIAQHVGTRSKDECKIFFIKCQKRLGLNLMHHRPEYNVPLVNDLNNGRNDKVDVCVAEADTIIGSDKPNTKTNGDEPSSSMNLNHDESRLVEASNLSISRNESKELEVVEVDHQDVNNISNSCAINRESNSEKMPKNVVLKLFGKIIHIPLSTHKPNLIS